MGPSKFVAHPGCGNPPIAKNTYVAAAPAGNREFAAAAADANVASDVTSARRTVTRDGGNEVANVSCCAEGAPRHGATRWWRDDRRSASASEKPHGEGRIMLSGTADSGREMGVEEWVSVRGRESGDDMLHEP